MKKRRRFLRSVELRLERGLPLLQRIPFRLQICTCEAVLDGLDDLLDVALDAFQIALGSAESRPLLHPEPIHLLRELAAELFEEILSQQFGLERVEHAAFDLQAGDPESVRTCSAVSGTEAAQELSRMHDEARAAFAALRQPGEQVLRSPKLVESLVVPSGLPFALNACVSRLHSPPQVIVDDAQFGHVLANPMRRRIHPRDTPVSGSFRNRCRFHTRRGRSHPRRPRAGGAEHGHIRAPRGRSNLDLILYGGASISAPPRLLVPHPRFRARGFVLAPLAEVAGDWTDPVTGLTVSTLLEHLDDGHDRPSPDLP